MVSLEQIAVSARGLRHLVGRLGAGQRGAAMLEFAFVAPVLLALLIGIADTNLQFFAQSNLDLAASKSARLLITGAAKSNNWSQANFKAAVCTKLPQFMDCAQLTVDVRRASNFADLDVSIPSVTVDASGQPNGASAYTTGNGGDVMIMRLMYLWPASYAPLGYGETQRYGGKRLLISTAVFKAEPF
jgi:Flp pilus assembly protein TadG